MRIVAVGEALIDLVQDADGRFAAHPGGSPFNVAITLGRLGCHVSFAGQAGTDPFGDLLADRLAGSNVHLDAWHRVTAPTSLAVAVLDTDGRADYTFYFDGSAGLAFPPPPTDSDVLHAGSIASWSAPSAGVVSAALHAARAGSGTLISYDVNARPALMPEVPSALIHIEKCVAAAHIVKASDEDIAFLYPGAAITEVARRWCDAGARLVVVTCGSDGAVAFTASGRLASVPAPPIVVADTVGAGDSFMGGLLAALDSQRLARPGDLAAALESRDPRIEVALHSAVTVAAITCERPGADPPTAAELAARLA